MGSTTARLYHDHMLTKEPGTRQPTPWHQDQPYYNVEGRQNVSFWIPVDPVSRASTPRIRRRLAPRALADAALLHGRPGEVVSRREPRRPAGYRGRPRPCRSWAGSCEPGDVGVFPHADPACRARRRRSRRRVFSVRFLGEDIAPCAAPLGRPRRISRGWRTSYRPARPWIIPFRLWRDRS